MPGIVDADTHIIEHPGIWEFMDKAWYSRRPVVLKAPSDTWYGGLNAFWLIDGEIFPRPIGKGSIGLHVPGGDREQARTDIPEGVRHLTDVPGRLHSMDNRDVDTEVIYPTLFITYLTDDVGLEIALCKAYNRFMGQVWEQGGGRIRWAAPLPLRSVDASIEEMRWVKEHGAVGLLFRGIEGDRSLAEPYFFPIYQAANDLDLAILVHLGGGSPAITKVFDIRYSGSLPRRQMPQIAFHDIVAHKIPEKFPALRFAFVEAGAAWVPYVLNLFKRHARNKLKIGEADLAGAENWGAQLFRDYRLYVACETDEDLPYLLNYIGEDNMIIGSDYGHQDQAREDGIVGTIRRREDLTPEAREKILSLNPRRLYGLPDER